MDGLSQAADQLLAELDTSPNYRPHAPTMVGVQKTSYTHEAMVELIIEKPFISQGELATHFGFSPPWICQIIASDAFQERLAARKNEIVDPKIKATLEERFRALLRRSLDVLDEKLAKPSAAIPDGLAIRAAELGARSLGIGRQEEQRELVAADRLVTLADRLITLQRSVHGKVIEGEVLPRDSDAESTKALSGSQPDGG